MEIVKYILSCIIGCFDALVGKNDVLKLNTIVPSNVYNYTTEFIEFKRLNNWY